MSITLQGRVEENAITANDDMLSVTASDDTGQSTTIYSSPSNPIQSNNEAGLNNKTNQVIILNDTKAALEALDRLGLQDIL